MTTTTRERGLILSAEDVLAVMSGAKTQHRVLLAKQPAPIGDNGGKLLRVAPDPRFSGCVHWDAQYELDNPRSVGKCPFPPGTMLYVRERIYIDNYEFTHGKLPKAWPDGLSSEDVYYRAAGTCCEQIPECECASYPGKTPWRASTSMPKWAARTWLRVTAVSVERDESGFVWVVEFELVPNYRSESE